MMNIYALISTLRSRLGISGTSEDATLEALLESSSRYIEELCRREFFSQMATRYYDTGEDSECLDLPDDLLSVTSLGTDTEGDGTCDGESWVEDSDFWLWPWDSFPKWQVRTTGFGDYSFNTGLARQVKIIGVFGYGDGTSDPWEEQSVTGTVATAAGTTLTLSASGTVEAGHTIKVEDEQMYVESVSEDETVTATVVRGVNGTTAAAHSAKAVSLAQYPRLITEACIAFATRFYRQLGSEQFESERIRDYSYKRFTGESETKRDKILVAGFLR